MNVVINDPDCIEMHETRRGTALGLSPSRGGVRVEIDERDAPCCIAAHLDRGDAVALRDWLTAWLEA